MKIHFLLLALLAFVALSQHNVDARLHDPAIRRMTEHRLLRRMTERNLLDELLQRRMEALEEGGLGGEDNNEGFEGRRLYYAEEGQCCSLLTFSGKEECVNICPYGHRWSPSCMSTRACKYQSKTDAERNRCKGKSCYKYADF